MGSWKEFERKMLRAGQKRLKTPEVAASRGADDGCLSPPGLRSWSGRTPGDSAALPVPARTCCLAQRWQCPILFWVPLSAPHPKGGAGGWAWGARDRPDLWDPGLWLSGEPVTRGSRLFRGWDTCGRRELVSLQAHK